MNKTLFTISILGAFLVIGGVYKLTHHKQAVVVPEASKDLFGEFKDKFTKSYNSKAEETYRLQVFHSNLTTINEHNSKKLSWTMAVNEFTDLTTEEFKAQYTGLIKGETKPSSLMTWKATTEDSKDWSQLGAVTDIKNQGQCGSCWAFSATGSMEAAYFQKTNKLVSLSEQQLVACSKASGKNAGCQGGLPDYAFDYAKINGMESEKDYPYAGMWYFSCKYDASKKISDFNMTSYVDVPKADSEQLKSVVSGRPVSIGIDAGHLQSYGSGVYDSSCGVQLDHGVLIVGYGTDSSSNKLYWKIKNSWGGSWGEKGFFRIRRDSAKGVGLCGLTEMASYPVLG